MKSRTGRAWYCSCRREAVIALRGLLRMLRRERRRSWSRPSWGQITSLCLDSLSHVGFCTSLKITRLWLTIVQLPVGAWWSVVLLGHGGEFVVGLHTTLGRNALVILIQMSLDLYQSGRTARNSTRHQSPQRVLARNKGQRCLTHLRHCGRSSVQA